MSSTHFFVKHSGYSYPSGASVKERLAARWAGARRLAAAEQWAESEGLEYRWVDDPNCGPDDFEFDDDKAFVREHGAVGCMLVRRCMLCVEGSTLGHRGDEPCKHDDVLGSLWGITESLNNRERDDYRRVVQAELALEAMPESSAR